MAVRDCFVTDSIPVVLTVYRMVCLVEVCCVRQTFRFSCIMKVINLWPSVAELRVKFCFCLPTYWFPQCVQGGRLVCVLLCRSFNFLRAFEFVCYMNVFVHPTFSWFTGEEPAGFGTIVVPHGCMFSCSYEEISEGEGTSERHHWKSERLRDVDVHKNYISSMKIFHVLGRM